MSFIKNSIFGTFRDPWPLCPGIWFRQSKVNKQIHKYMFRQPLVNKCFTLGLQTKCLEKKGSFLSSHHLNCQLLEKLINYKPDNLMLWAGNIQTSFRIATNCFFETDFYSSSVFLTRHSATPFRYSFLHLWSNCELFGVSNDDGRWRVWSAPRWWW